MKTIGTYLDYVKKEYGITDGYDLERAIFFGQLPNGEQVGDFEQKRLLERLCEVIFSARDTLEQVKHWIDEV